MKARGFFLLALTLSLSADTLLAASPVVSNVRSTQRPGTKLVDIYYDVSDADGGTVTVEVHVSGNGGLTYEIPAVTLSGHVGTGVALGSNRHLVWNAGADWNNNYIANTKVRVTAHDGSGPAVPFEMVYIRASPFQRGDNLDSMSNAPLLNVYVSDYFIDKYEVTKDKWDAVIGWANVNGYSLPPGPTKASFHPIHTVTWFDAVIWCNARSEKEGLEPCYYTNEAKTTVYRSGAEHITNTMVKWNANGYRLPTEAEWEKAARGGEIGNRYPWGDTIGYSDANYSGHPTYSVGLYPYTSPVGSFAANGFGLYDVAGNVVEWCWDWYGNYGSDDTDPQGPETGSYRVLRGGSWHHDSSYCRVAYRDWYEPALGYVNSHGFGFRTIRR